MTSLTYTIELIQSIMSFENSKMSPVSLHLQNDVETNIYFIEPFSGVSFPLFLCCKTMDGSTLFNLRSNTSLSSIFHFISYPEQYTTNPFFRDALFISNLGWMKSFIMSIKSQVGLSLFKEIANSVLIDLSIKMNDKKSIIQLNFSKHSTVLNKNVHYNIYFDLSFNFIDVEFLSYAYIDNSQVEQLSKFSSSNKLMAFYVLLHYYTNIDMHNNLVSMLNVENDLNDDNLSICNSIVSMNEI